MCVYLGNRMSKYLDQHNVYIKTQDGKGRCVHAKTKIKAGDVVFRSIPTAAVLQAGLSEDVCFSCFRNTHTHTDTHTDSHTHAHTDAHTHTNTHTNPHTDTHTHTHNKQTLKRCSQCKRVRYCSIQCQKRDWKYHKHECKHLRPFFETCLVLNMGSDVYTDGQLLGRLLHVLSTLGDGDGEIHTDNTYGSILSASCADIKNMAETSQHAYSDTAVYAIVHSGLLPTHTDTQTANLWLRRFKCNNFGICDDLFSVKGAGIYPLGALLNHDCVPNCLITYDQDQTQTVRAVRNIDAGEELCHSFVDVCTPTSSRRRELKKWYGFDCICLRCKSGIYITKNSPAKNKNEDICEKYCELETALLADSYNNIIYEYGDTHTHTDTLKHLHKLHELCVDASNDTDIYRELKLLKEAAGYAEKILHPQNIELYKIRTQTFDTALIAGDYDTAVCICEKIIEFLTYIYHTLEVCPLIGLQLHTLGDLYESVGDKKKAKITLAKSFAIICITHGPHHKMAVELKERLQEL